MVSTEECLYRTIEWDEIATGLIRRKVNSNEKNC